MINIKKEDLDSLEHLKTGCFGTIYRKDDKVYKIYNDDIKCQNFEMKRNPMLSHRILSLQKLKRLISLRDTIKQTDLIEDIIYMNGKLYGVVMPYYDGKLFIDLLDRPIKERIDYSKQLLKVAKELTDNNIYPTDYKLINMFLVNKRIKLIDLDDIFTKVTLLSNPIFEIESVNILDETIKAFLSENKHYVCDLSILERLSREHYKLNNSYKGIEDYLELKSIPRDYIFVKGESTDIFDDLSVDNHNIIYVFDRNNYSKEEIIKYINRLKEKRINLYDVVDSEHIDEYLNNHQYNSFLFLNNNEIKLKKKQM